MTDIVFEAVAASSAELRFRMKVRIDGRTGCWNWAGAISSNGYGTFAKDAAHRWSYRHFVGPIGDGLDLDHLCRNRSCVRPSHLEPVTRSENLLRGYAARGLPTSCKRGHDYTPENTGINPTNGRRFCRECGRSAKRAYKARQRMSATEAAMQHPTQPERQNP